MVNVEMVPVYVIHLNLAIGMVQYAINYDALMIVPDMVSAITVHVHVIKRTVVFLANCAYAQVTKLWAFAAVTVNVISSMNTRRNVPA
jgi:hypothetical protein